MTDTTTPSRKPSVSANDVANLLRESIRRGRFVPGQRLVEIDLIRESGATRSRVREALQRLEAEGIVVIEEFRGASVRSFSEDEVRQIYSARMVLEGLAAREFAAADKPAEKARLAEIQAGMNQWETTGNHDHYARLNSEWHTLIINGSGNSYVRDFLSRLTVPIHRLLFSTFYNAQRIDSANADHKLITAAIIDGRPDDAEMAMRRHIEQGFQALSVINFARQDFDAHPV